MEIPTNMLTFNIKSPKILNVNLWWEAWCGVKYTLIKQSVSSMSLTLRLEF